MPPKTTVSMMRARKGVAQPTNQRTFYTPDPIAFPLTSLSFEPKKNLKDSTWAIVAQG